MPEKDFDSFLKVNNLINKFANSFDLKDWDGLKSVIAETVLADYADLRGAVETASKDEFVEQRKSALEHLKTHHLISNIEFLQLESENAFCRATSLIFRLKWNKVFHSHVMYDFRLKKESGEWKMFEIKQKVLWNEGESSIHSGAR